jgi:hypothetical protein
MAFVLMYGDAMYDRALRLFGKASDLDDLEDDNAAVLLDFLGRATVEGWPAEPKTPFREAKRTFKSELEADVYRLKRDQQKADFANWRHGVWNALESYPFPLYLDAEAAYAAACEAADSALEGERAEVAGVLDANYYALDRRRAHAERNRKPATSAVATACAATYTAALADIDTLRDDAYGAYLAADKAAHARRDAAHAAAKMALDAAEADNAAQLDIKIELLATACIGGVFADDWANASPDNLRALNFLLTGEWRK